MFELDEKVLNVSGHTDTTPAGCVVPFDVNTCKLVSVHVELYPMELLENIAEVVEVFNPNILHPKVINYETELDGMPFVVPEAWGGFGLEYPSIRRRDWRKLLARVPAWGRP